MNLLFGVYNFLLIMSEINNLVSKDLIWFQFENKQKLPG